MMDEISTGLDSSTTHQITKILANYTHMRQATVLLALLQPAPEARHRPCPRLPCSCDLQYAAQRPHATTWQLSQ